MSRAPLRLRTALPIAAAGHIVATLSFLAVPSTHHSARSELQQEITLSVEPETAARESAIPVSEERAPIMRASSDTSRTKMLLPAAHAREATAPQVMASGESPAPESSWSFDPVSRSASDIGIGSHWKSVVREGAGPAHDGASSAPAIDRSMREMLTARDIELGLGRSGPLVSATHEAASSPTAPEVGTTILEVESDAGGVVVAARAEDHAWNAVASAVVRQMVGKPLRVRSGARGLRARLRVVVEHALPAGARGSSALGAVPDDVPGGGKACVGEGLTRRCVAGMPVGVTSAGSDLSNVGAKPKRVVHVQLLSESEL